MSNIMSAIKRYQLQVSVFDGEFLVHTLLAMPSVYTENTSVQFNIRGHQFPDKIRELLNAVGTKTNITIGLCLEAIADNAAAPTVEKELYVNIYPPLKEITESYMRKAVDFGNSRVAITQSRKSETDHEFMLEFVYTTSA